MEYLVLCLYNDHTLDRRYGTTNSNGMSTLRLIHFDIGISPHSAHFSLVKLAGIDNLRAESTRTMAQE